MTRVVGLDSIPQDTTTHRYLSWYIGMELVFVGQGTPDEQVIVTGIGGDPSLTRDRWPDELVFASRWHLREIFVHEAFPGLVLIRLAELWRTQHQTTAGPWELAFDARGFVPLQSLDAAEDHAEHEPRERPAPVIRLEREKETT